MAIITTINTSINEKKGSHLPKEGSCTANFSDATAENFNAAAIPAINEIIEIEIHWYR